MQLAGISFMASHSLVQLRGAKILWSRRANRWSTCARWTASAAVWCGGGGDIWMTNAHKSICCCRASLPDWHSWVMLAVFLAARWTRVEVNRRLAPARASANRNRNTTAYLAPGVMYSRLWDGG